MRDIRVSIVVPVYNQEKYLKKSIPALTNQLYTNLEIILVNDGSTDSSLKILESFAQLDKRIRIIDKKNGGLVDATIAGIKESLGDYIAFLDPDDYIGEDYIANFINAMDQEYDFIAAGFYNDYLGSLRPYSLKQNSILESDEIRKLRTQFLIGASSPDIPNDIFVSRWNKIYRKSCILKMLDKFSECKNISLGEDSIFTYLVLLNSERGKTIKASNSYFYNIGNQNSMMKNGAIEKHLKKSKDAFETFSCILNENGDLTDQAYALYGHLIESLIFRLRTSREKEYYDLLKLLKKDEIYCQALDVSIRHSLGARDKIKYYMRRNSTNADACFAMTEKSKKILKKAKEQIQDSAFVIKGIKKNGWRKTKKQLRFRKNRRTAFDDLYKMMPELEKRIEPFLQPYMKKETDYALCPIEKNVFVFWWDGFEQAPEVVKECLASVKCYYYDYNIIEITKLTYRDFTDIHTEIINGFENGSISVQTFSDILRFNLLKNNGGIWIDATIFFTSKFEMIETLRDKSFESVQFSSSGSFLQYKEQVCSWSGYFIASRKNGLLVSAADHVFEQYYLKYKTYSIYFFIDALMMILKLNKIDNDVLSRVQSNSGDMFLLGKLFDSEYSELYMTTVCKIPQKLQWGFKISSDKNNLFRKLIECRKKDECDNRIK